MSENIQPSSEDNQIVEDLAKEDLTGKLPEFNDNDLISNAFDWSSNWIVSQGLLSLIFTPDEEQLLKKKQSEIDKRRFEILVNNFFMIIF